MASALVELTAIELAQRIANGELSSVEVVTAHLDRIDEVNPTVNAIVSMRARDEIIADAATADASEPAGPLHGLPVAVKDLQDVAGLRTSLGSVITPDVPAAADGLVAARFRAAGAIIVGKTNTPEFGTGSHTFNEVFGTTRNPWNLNRIAGGSSGGAAAALASRMLPIADGSDLGGSLRNPAAMCGVVGLRPSVGRIPNPVAPTTHLRLGVDGPMGRTVADAALVMSALAGPDDRDPWARPEPGDAFMPPLPTTTTATLAWAGDLGLFTCDPESLSICEKAARSITTVGGAFEEAAPELTHAESIFRVLRGAGYAGMASRLPEGALARTKQTVQDNVAYGESLSVADVLQAEEQKADLHRTMSDFFDEYDILALPTTQVPAFPVEVEYPTEINDVQLADYLSWMMSCCVITATGCPAISIPAGFNKDGLPVGLQLVTRLGHERQLLEIAAAIEAAQPWHGRAPGVISHAE
ncbi:MAG: amidase [Acidimicrobiales bacterium]|nr:amidase [Acidimicrobiales bacterium]RZV48345.1 MAG: amidase [Acidimicrobiales bacterium]